MANITQRTNKDGTISYLIRAYVDETGSGKQLVRCMTYRPAPNTRPSAALKQTERQAALFEDKVKRGLLSGAATRFGDYCRTWLDAAQIAPKTREGYEGLMKRIEPALGHIKLEKLQAHHLEEFYKNLSEKGMKQSRAYAIARAGLAEKRKKAKLSQEDVSRSSGISVSTINLAERGQRISKKTSERYCKALGLKTESAFELFNDDETLSGNTVRHYLRFISAVLAKAKRERLVPFNVAQEHTTAPKVEKKETQYYDDDEARAFLACLMNERDVRLKAALIVLLFTGVRRGELCGLHWSDIDERDCIINVMRSALYYKGIGVVEAPTKTASSVRAIKVPSLVIEQLKEYKHWQDEQRLLYGRAWRGDGERVFTSDDGGMIDPNSIYHGLKKFLTKNNLPYISPHGLRHTFATLQITAGVDIRTLQARTGHAQASTLVNVYSHAIKRAQEAATEALESVLLPNETKADMG